MHRYIGDVSKFNGFKGELIVLSDGDWDNIDEKTYARLEKAKDYIVIFYEDDIAFETKADIQKAYEEQDKKELQEDGINSYKEWLMDRDVLTVIVQEMKNGT